LLKYHLIHLALHCFHTSHQAPILAVLEQCGKTPADVDEVLLAGGIAHMPRIQSMVKDMFPEGTVFGTGLFPDEVTVLLNSSS
jgi:molecular chaperone DnaK (HSP70)